jgi:hypothetical protein
MFSRIFSFAIFPKSVGTDVVILVIWSFVKIENRKSKSATIIINIYIYLIVSNDRVSEIDFDHFDHDHFDHDLLKRDSSLMRALMLPAISARVLE